MAEIFLSWTSANRAVVKPLVTELKNLGFDVFDYEADMGVGQQIPDSVRDEIKKALVAVICFDDATYDKEWILNEVAWSVAAVQDGTMKGIVPVWVGPHPDNLLPALIANQYPAFDMETRTRDRVLDLTSRLVKYLPDAQRHVVYAALYSMNAEQFVKVRENDPVVGGLRFSDYIDRVCRQLGMPQPPELLDILSKRYGTTADDVKPFQDGTSVMSLVYENLGKVNHERANTPNARQLFIRWVRDELAGKAGVKERDRVNARWESGDSLLIVDSLSLWCDDVKNEFLDASPGIATTSIVWIPPFTQQTGALYDMLNQSWSIVQRLRNEFNRWEEDPNRNVTCEITSPFALGRWLHRTLKAVQGQANPLADNLKSLPQAPQISTANFYQ